MQKQDHTLRDFFVAVAACVLPFALLPPLFSLLPAQALPALTFTLIYLACPILSAIFPYRIARRAIAPIAAWPWPLVGYLLLPLYGIRPSFAILAACALIALVSGVCGDETRKLYDKKKEGKRR